MTFAKTGDGLRGDGVGHNPYILCVCACSSLNFPPSRRLRPFATEVFVIFVYLVFSSYYSYSPDDFFRLMPALISYTNTVNVVLARTDHLNKCAHAIFADK